MNGKSYRHAVELWLPELGGDGNMELLFNGHRVLVCQDEKSARLMVVIAAQQYECT